MLRFDHRKGPGLRPALSTWLSGTLTRSLDPGLDERSHIYHASVAAEYSVSAWLRVVSDLSVERNAERSGHPNVCSMVIGVVLSLTPALDFDLGYRTGLTDPAADHNRLTCLAFRF